MIFSLAPKKWHWPTHLAYLFLCLGSCSIPRLLHLWEASGLWSSFSLNFASYVETPLRFSVSNTNYLWLLDFLSPAWAFPWTPASVFTCLLHTCLLIDSVPPPSHCLQTQPEASASCPISVSGWVHSSGWVGGILSPLSLRSSPSPGDNLFSWAPSIHQDYMTPHSLHASMLAPKPSSSLAHLTAGTSPTCPPGFALWSSQCIHID